MQFLFQHPTASSTDVDAFPRSRLDINAERDIVIGRVANAVAGGPRNANHYARCKH